MPLSGLPKYQSAFQASTICLKNSATATDTSSVETQKPTLNVIQLAGAILPIKLSARDRNGMELSNLTTRWLPASDLTSSVLGLEETNLFTHRVSIFFLGGAGGSMAAFFTKCSCLPSVKVQTGRPQSKHLAKTTRHSSTPLGADSNAVNDATCVASNSSSPPG